jgi:hypothetical protein
MKPKRKQTIIYGVLTAHICVFLYLLVTASYHQPDRIVDPKTWEEKLKIDVETPLTPTNMTQPPQPNTRDFAQYGRKDVFRSIMPTPSPPPTRTPRPTPTPSLEKVMKNYELTGVLTNLALVYNKRKKTDEQLRVGESFSEEDRNIPMKIELISVDITRFTATFKFQDQTETLTLTF